MQRRPGRRCDPWPSGKRAGKSRTESFIGSRGLGRVGIRDALIQAGILLVGVEVIRGLLAGGVWRIADDHVDGGILLPLDGGVVFPEDVEVWDISVFVDLEGIR